MARLLTEGFEAGKLEDFPTGYQGTIQVPEPMDIPYTPAWTSWNSTSAATTYQVTNNSDSTWYVWVGGDTTPFTTMRQSSPQVVPSAEALERARVEREREAERRAEETKAKQEAKKKARQLLLDHLTPQERTEYCKNRCITLQLEMGLFRITHEESYNIYELNERHRAKAKYCVQVASLGFPTEDQMLAQYLHLKTNPAHLFAIANKRLQ